MRQVLAVDGGQSAIRLRHSEGMSPVEVEGVSRLEGDVVGSVGAAIARGWRAAGSPSVERAVLGLTTAPSDEASRRRLCGQVAADTGAPEIWLSDDAVTAHAGALSLGWGVSITAGTGVACMVVPREGAPSIIGGHGYLLGDEGGAWWVGREGLRAVLRAHDGRGPMTALVESAARRFDGLDDLGDRLHSAPRPVDAIARFAPDVLEAAEARDDVAASITDEAAHELETLTRAAVAAAAADGELVPVALGGRLLGAGPLRRRLEIALEREPRVAAVRSADANPLEGALLLGIAGDPGRYAGLLYRWESAQ